MRKKAADKSSKTPPGLSRETLDTGNQARVPRRLVIAALFAGAALLAPWYLMLPLTARPASGIQSAVWSEVAAQVAVVAVAGVLARAPVSRRFLLGTFNRVRRPSSLARAITALLLGAFAAFYCYCNAIFAQRTLLPFWHDEEMHRLQTQIFSQGHLWMPGHPLAAFFEAFYLDTTPVYSPIYFPGTSMLHVPGVWLGLPYFVIPLCIAGATAALLYLVVTELIDGLSGLLSVLLLISAIVFRVLSVMEMSHAAILMWELLFAWSWLCWRRNPRAWCLWLGGAVAGWAAITRPVDAACVVGPMCVAWGVDILRRQGAKRLLMAMGIVAIAAAPFVALQLAMDAGLTGHALRSPLGEYDRRYFQILGLGFHKPDPKFRPPTTLVQFQRIYSEFFYPQMKGYTPAEAVRRLFHDRLPVAANGLIASSFLLPFLAVGVLGLRNRPRLAICIVPILFMLTMSLYFSFLDHYCAVMIGGVILLMLIGGEVIEHTFKAEGRTAVAWRIIVAGLAILGLPGVSGRGEYSTRNFVAMEMNYRSIPATVETPAIVLFRLGGTGNVHEEPAYNWDVAWPDDAQIIRAHDLGDDRNLELFRYYAAKQPGRHVYLFDRATFELKPLGRVEELAKPKPRGGQFASDLRPSR